MTDPERYSVDELLHAWRAEEPGVETASASQREAAVGVIRHTLRQVAAGRSRRRALRWIRPAAAAAVALGLASAAAYAVVATVGEDAQVAESAMAAKGGDQFVVRALAGFLVTHGEDGVQLVGSGAERQLHTGDVLSTPSDGLAQIGLAGGGVMTLAAASEIAIPESTQRLQQIQLNTGLVSVDVPPSEQRERTVVVRTPHADVVVHGTMFDVAVRTPPGESHDVTRVRVTRGVVWVVAGGEKLAELGAGDTWSSAGASDTAVVDETDEVSEPERVEDSAASARVGLAEQSSAPTNAAQQRGANPRAAASRFDEPASEESSGVSERLAAENREFRDAVTTRNQGDLAGAVRRFEQFLQRYPSSVLRQEAKVERFRALYRLGRTAEAARAARRYLAEYEQGYAREEARRLVFTQRSADGAD